METCDGCGQKTKDLKKKTYYPWTSGAISRKCPECRWCPKCNGTGSIKELSGATDFWIGPCEECDGRGVKR